MSLPLLLCVFSGLDMVIYHTTISPDILVVHWMYGFLLSENCPMTFSLFHVDVIYCCYTFRSNYIALSLTLL